jgi:hypothetical protein
MKSKHRTAVKVWIVIKILMLVLIFWSCFRNPDQLLLTFVCLILLMYNLKSRCEIILITNDEVKIKNYFTLDKKIYRFDEFDDIVEILNEVDNLDGQSLYLRKGGIVFGKIRSRNYQNIQEIVSFIQTRKLQTLSH